jgi:YebC/PmpR family DNA-binding regulatory protein
MSGHSKWATIKRQKGANDAKRGQLFTKLSKAITLAVQQGGGVADPDSNFRLRLSIESARIANMPKENIERAIQRASGKQSAHLEEATYEGFGPGGFSVIVEALTDNILRTVSEVKMTFNKNGGTMGAQGSVLYQFERKGSIILEKNGTLFDAIFMMAADAGVDDLEDAENEVILFTKAEEVAKVRDTLANQGLAIKSAELIYKPIVLTAIVDVVAAQKALAFLDKMESLDDVQKVYATFDIPDELIEESEA